MKNVIGGRFLPSSLKGLQATAGEIDASVIGLNDLAFLGDSRCYNGNKEYLKQLASANTMGVKLAFLGGGIYTPTGDGTLEYRASDRSLRWTAPSDTAGEWVQITQAGRYKIESGAVGKDLNIYITSYSTLPTTDKTITISCSGTLSLNVGSTSNFSMSTQVIGAFRNNQVKKILGVGGSNASDMVELTPFYASEAGNAGGIDVIRIGTNDISVSTPSATILSNALTFFNSRLSIGRKLVICGEPARWGVDTSTAMTAEQLAILMAVNKGYKAFCDAHPMQCVYVDLYGISVDSSYKDGRPATGILKDTVHDGVIGSVSFGNAIVTAIKKLGLKGDEIYPQRGDISNLLQVGWMSGTGGTIGTGASGVCPSNFSLSRVSGSDATVVGSIFTKTSPWIASGLTMTIAGTASGNMIQLVNSSPTGITLAALGKEVGDTLRLSLDLEVVSATNITSIQALLQINGTTTVKTEIDFLPIVGSFIGGKSHDIEIPAGATNVTVYVWVTVGASSSAVINVSDIIIE